MKAMTFFLASISIVWMCNGIATAAEAEVNTIRTISVTGTAEVQTPPDIVVWWVNLIEQDKNLLAAKKRSDERAKTVVALREKLVRSMFK